MKTAQQLAEEIVGREGGYVNDPSDPGGPTNWGVTLGTMKTLGIDLTGDGRVTAADVRVLPKAQAIEIYLDHYFHRPKIDQLPQVLQPGVFDMSVNAGSNAIKLLQRMLTARGFPCAVDGQIGPQVIYAAQAAFDHAPGDLADAYAIARRDYYYRVADGRPASRKYARRKNGGKGNWITRAEEFMRPELRLTEAQHRARTANWA